MRLLFQYKKTLIIFIWQRKELHLYLRGMSPSGYFYHTLLLYFGAIGFEPMTSWTQIKRTNSTVLCPERKKRDSNSQLLVRQTNALPLSYSSEKIKNEKTLNSFSSSINNNKKKDSHYINKMSISCCTFISNMITYSKVMLWKTS